MNRSIFACMCVLAGLLTAAVAHGDLAPRLGRYIQRDPNGSAQPVLSGATWFGGRAPRMETGQPDAEYAYGDGMSLHQYARGNPMARRDPMGLETGDDAIAAYFQQVAGIYDTLGDARVVALDGIRKEQAYIQLAHAWDGMIMDRDEGILLGMVMGPFLSRACFEADTPVVLADGSSELIECLELGRAVFSTRDSTSPARSNLDPTIDPDASDGINAASWRRVDMRLDDSEHGAVSVSLLRPAALVTKAGIREGMEIRFDMASIGVHGKAQVLAVRPCPELPKHEAGGHIVTGTFVTERAPLLSIVLQDGTLPIAATASHPFFSVDRREWIKAIDLQHGESIRTLTGSVTIERIGMLKEAKTVYNLEVQNTHTYYVGEARVWVHNSCENLFDMWEAGNSVRAKCSAAWMEHVFEHLQKFCGASRIALSEALHALKAAGGVAADADCYFGLSGDVWDNAGNYLGNLLK